MKNREERNNGNKRAVLTVVSVAYLCVWAISLAVFWLMTDGGDAFGYSVIFFWFVFPVTMIILSFIIGRSDHLGKERLITPIVFGILYMLADYTTFSIANMIAFGKINAPSFELVFSGAFISLIGLSAGIIVRAVKASVR